jgi:hypothetical protein
MIFNGLPKDRARMVFIVMIISAAIGLKVAS